MPGVAMDSSWAMREAVSLAFASLLGVVRHPVSWEGQGGLKATMTLGLLPFLAGPLWVWATPHCGPVPRHSAWPVLPRSPSFQRAEATALHTVWGWEAEGCLPRALSPPLICTQPMNHSL